MRFLGWANGLFIAPYIRTADAPKDPITITRSVSLSRLKLIKATEAIPKKAPIHDQRISDKPAAGGLWVVPDIFLK
jgi:hypothetical protein